MVFWGCIFVICSFLSYIVCLVDWGIVMVSFGLSFCYFVAHGAPFFLPVVVATAFL